MHRRPRDRSRGLCALTYLVYAIVLVALAMLLFGFFLLLFGATLTPPSPRRCIAA